MPLYTVICAAFSVLVVVSNVISAKMLHIPFLGEFSIPAGLIIYPLTFLLSDLATELYGSKKAKQMIYISLGLSIFTYGLFEFVMWLPTLDSTTQIAFEAVFGVNGILIFSSLIAYVIAQILDVQLYAYFKNMTGEKMLWFRNNGSTLTSQVVDTIVVNTIYLYWGLHMPLELVVQVIVFSYAYKAAFSIANTPLFYLLVYLTKWKYELRNTNTLTPTLANDGAMARL